MKQLLYNRYQVLQPFGEEGGFGKTFLAVDTQDTHFPSKRKCIIKKFNPPEELDTDARRDMLDRFEREGKILKLLSASTTQVPKLYDYFKEDEEYYIVQEFIEGKTLKEKVRDEGMFDEGKVKTILSLILPVLDYAHSKGIIHRDIKPTNLMLRDSDRMPVLIDFGSVKEVITTAVDTYGMPVNSSIRIGTKGYTPLEQWNGRPVFASDLYSLALTGIYLLTGKRPQNITTDSTTGDFQWRKYVPTAVFI